MYERNPNNADVMANYFETMRQFLETQGQVMAAYMGEASPMPRATYARAPRMAAAIPAMPVAAMPAPQPVAAPAPIVAAPAPAPTPAVAVEVPVAAAPAAPAPAPAPAAAPAPQPAAADSAFDREKLADLLLGIVEEKTGYPRDMVGLDQGLEADLGIDSIKRIEVVGAMLQALPESMREALTPNRSKLNTQATLNGMLDILAQAAPGASAKAGGSVRELHAEERRRA